MRRLLIPVLSSMALFFTLSTQTWSAAQSETSVWQRPNWDKEIALLTASLADTDAQVNRLSDLVRRSSAAQSLQALNQFSQRSDWSVPAREATLFQFTNQLRLWPPFSVDASVLDFLRNYQNQVLVAHEESWSYGVALYPISAVAQGVIHQWTRQQASDDATQLILADPRGLVDRYIDTAEQNIQAGIEDALAGADQNTLRLMLDYALPQLSAHPQLTGLSGKAAVQLADMQALAQVMVHGQGHMLVEVTRQATKKLPSKRLGDLLLASMDTAPVSTAAMLIAELAPYTVRDEVVGDALMQKLEHRELGSTVALALVSWGSDEQLQALMNKALADESSLTAKRVQSALSASRASRSRELQR